METDHAVQTRPYAIDEELPAYGTVLARDERSLEDHPRSLRVQRAERKRALFDVHVFGAERVTRAVAPAMRAQGGGTIVNITTPVAWVPMPGASAYCAAKAAVVAISEGLRAELADACIDVRLFAPPFTRTDSDRQWPLDRTRVYERE